MHERTNEQKEQNTIVHVMGSPSAEYGTVIHMHPLPVRAQASAIALVLFKLLGKLAFLHVRKLAPRIVLRITLKISEFEQSKQISRVDRYRHSVMTEGFYAWDSPAAFGTGG